MAHTQKYVNIYTEANPNPNSMKFAVNFMLVPDGLDFDFASADAAEHSPLAQALFAQFPFIERVFIMSNFVTITKQADVDWHEAAPDVREFLKEWFLEEKDIISASAFIKEEYDENDSETVRKIKGLLDEYVRPAVEGDGGAINFRSFVEGVVTVELRGSCSGCPSSTLTLKSGIENLLKRMVPEVQSVVAEGV